MSSSQMITRFQRDVSPSGVTQVLRSSIFNNGTATIAPGLSRDDLVSVLRIEFRRSWFTDAPLTVEQCRSLLDQADALPDDWIELISCEVALRRLNGNEPTPEEYSIRFPELADRVGEIFERSKHQEADEPTHQERPYLVKMLDDPGNTLIQGVLPAAGGPTWDTQVPGYDVLGVLGRGGMGVVYKARHVALNRVVALKMILAGAQADEDDLARFRQEAEAIAELHHPNIVQVLEIGEHNGTPFYSMEYIEGGTLSKLINNQPQSATFAAELTETLARAIDATHQRNIIHRDLKPGNILLGNAECGIRNSEFNTPQGDASSNLALKQTQVPKITDFGLAKRLDRSLALSSSGLIAGTPQYMSPEQITHRPGSVGPATDIYSLGVILYEMLTGHPPFQGSTPAEILNHVLRQEPVPIRHLQPKTPRDLETICLKCLEKEPARRYTRAEDLADDLDRYRNGVLIKARPIGIFGLAQRWCRRNPAVASLILLTTFVLIAGAGVASYFAYEAAGQARRAEQNEREARQAANELRDEKKIVEQAHLELSLSHQEVIDGQLKLKKALQQASDARQEEERLKREAVEREQSRARELYDSQMLQAFRAWEVGQVASSRRILAAQEPARHDQPDYRGFEWHYLTRLNTSYGVQFFVPDGCRSVAISPDGKRIIWAFRNVCEIWDLTGSPKRITALGQDPRTAHQHLIERVAFDPTGKRIATSSHDKTIKIWDAQTYKLLRTISTGEVGSLGLRFAPGGGFVAAVLADESRVNKPGQLVVWDVATGEKAITAGHDASVHDLAYSPDGNRIATAGADGAVRVWDSSSGKLIHTLPLPSGVAARSVTFAPKGSLLAAGTSRGEILLWNHETWKEVRRLHGHVNWVHSLAFHEDGRTLASAGSDQLLKIWDASTGEERRTYRGHTQALVDVAWAPGTPFVYSAGMDQTILSWNTAEDPEHFVIQSRWGPLTNIHLLPDQWRVAVAGGPGFVGVWDSRQGKSLATADFRMDGRGPISSSALAPDGRSLTFVRADLKDDEASAVYSWDLEAKQPTLFELPGLAQGVRRIAYRQDSKRLATMHRDGTIQVHSLVKQETPVTWKISGRGASDVLFRPGYPNHLLVLGVDVAPRLYLLDDLSSYRDYSENALPSRVAAFSRDGQWLATAGDDLVVRVWNFTSGRIEYKLEGHTGAIRSLVFSPEGDRLLSGSADLTMKLWDLRTGQETLTLRGHTRDVTGAIFSDDGRRILSTSPDQTIRVWEAGAVTDREFLRAAAVACRIDSFRLEGKAVSGSDLSLHYKLANVTGKAWPVPPAKLLHTPHRTVLRVSALELVNGVPDPVRTAQIGKHSFFPVEGLKADDTPEGDFPVSFRYLKPGAYRVRLQHGWQGNDFVPISEQSINVTVEPDPTRKGE